MEESSSSFIILAVALLFPIILSFKPRLALLTQVITSLILMIFALSVISNNLIYDFSIQSNIPFLNFNFHLDNISAVFIIVVSLISMASSIYSLDYIQEYKNKFLLVFLFTSFISSMIIVLLSFNGFLFLIFWEIMSVLSFLLVIYEYKKEENEYAGFIYILMTHIGTAFIFLSFMLLYMETGSLEFKDWINLNTDVYTKFFIFLLALIGFGTKAGIFPLHIWLPKAHPVAPSNVSALMSGVMIKIPVYMLIRFYFEFLNSYPWWFGFIVLGVGSITALSGILYAYPQKDLKGFLAYSSMENIGIVLIALGTSMIFKSNNLYILSALALVATLFHVLNHAVFKGTLFLSAGAVLFKTHTKNIEKLGGLIKFMPFTAFIFLIASLSISAFPPFNGFISEWLIYQSLLLSSNVNIDVIKIFTPVFASILAFTGAVVASSFVKVFGVSFLGNPRSEDLKELGEVGPFMILGMFFLAVLCFLMGIFPLKVIEIFSPAVYSLTSVNILDNISSYNGFVITITDYHFGKISPFGIFIAGILMFAVLYMLMAFFRKNKDVRIYKTWSCGLDEYNFRAQYSATGFSYSLRRVFSIFYKQTEKLQPIEENLKYFLPKKRYYLYVNDLWDVFYEKVSTLLIKVLIQIRRVFQAGIIHVYLAFIILTLIILLIYVMWL